MSASKTPEYSITPQEWESRKNFFNFTDDDANRIALLRSLAEKKIADFQTFYLELCFQAPEFRVYFPTEEAVEYFERQQKQRILEMFEGKYDHQYALSRSTAMLALHGMEQPLRWNLSTHDQLSHFFSSAIGDPESRSSFLKLISLERDLLASTHSFISQSIRNLNEQFWNNKDELGSFFEVVETLQNPSQLINGVLQTLSQIFHFGFAAFYKCENDVLLLEGSYSSIQETPDLPKRLLSGERLAGRAMRERNLVSTTELPFEFKRLGFNDSVAIPTISGGEMSGVLVFLSVHKDGMEKQQLNSLLSATRIFSSVLGIKSHTQNLLNRETEFFARILKKGSEAGTESELLQIFLATLCEFWEFDYGCFWKPDLEDEALHFHLDCGHEVDSFRKINRNTTFYRGQGLVGRAWESRNVVAVENLQELQNSPRREAAEKDDLKLAVSFPLWIGEKIVGVVDFVSKTEATLSESRLGAIENLARTVSLLLVNVQRKAETQAQTEAVAEVTRVLSLVAGGDLTEEVDGVFEGNLALLKSAIGVSLSRVREIVTETLEASSSVTQAANEIAQGNADLSQRTERQAGNLEKTAETLKQLAMIIAKNANNAHRSSDLASEAKGLAEQGGGVIKDATLAMNSIRDSAHQISDILGVMDEIAFQTNLLALNAAVEAARAGEQGRGFAVVAAEVRSLAQRSATAAKEIKSLIKSSLEYVSGGVRLVTESQQALTKIVESNTQLSDFASQIAIASREQSVGLSEINKGVEQLELTTQQNAALVEESATAAESLSAQAQHLQRVVSFFRVGELNHPTSVFPAVSSDSRNSREVGTNSLSRTEKALSEDSDIYWKEF